MRRLVPFAMALLPAIPLVIGGCEDGPTQTCSPAAQGAGSIWNGSNGAGGLGDGGANVPTGTENYDASFGGTNANDLCTADQEKAIWAELFPAPILIPGLAAGIDAAGGPNGDGASGWTPNANPPWKYDITTESWTGATVEQIEKILCQGVAYQEFIGLTNELAWGESDEFAVLYNTNNRIVTDLLINQGFPGAMTATTADGKTTYVVSMNNTWMTKSVSGGQPENVVIDWTNKNALNALVNSMYDAFRTTYAPYIQPDLNCGTDGQCPIGINGVAGGYFYFAPIALAIYVNATIGSPAVQSFPFILQVSVLKQLPFSAGDNLMQFDAAGKGPTVTALKAGGTLGNGGDCIYHLGMNFKDFNSQCVQVYGSSDPNQAKDNKVAQNKLYGGMNHSDEAFSFQVVGVDPNFVASSLPSNQVISDTLRPADGDTAYNLTIDQVATGKILNDYTNNDATLAQDWHGIGMVTLEWANLVQQYARLTAGVNTQLGDPVCLTYLGKLFDDPSTPAPAGKVCSGMEGIVTSAPTALAPAYPLNAIGSAAMTLPSMPSNGLHPGTWYSVFCADNGGLTASGNPNGYNKCVGSTNNFPTPTGVTPSYYFDTAQKIVNLAFHGNPPGNLARLRFYWKEWVLAFVKYLQTADNPAASLATVDANPVSEDDLFFDSAGGGFEQAEYVYRAYVNSVQGRAARHQRSRSTSRRRRSPTSASPSTTSAGRTRSTRPSRRRRATSRARSGCTSRTWSAARCSSPRTAPTPARSTPTRRSAAAPSRRRTRSPATRSGRPTRPRSASPSSTSPPSTRTRWARR